MEQVLNSLKLPTDNNIRYLLVILVGYFVGDGIHKWASVFLAR